MKENGMPSSQVQQDKMAIISPNIFSHRDGRCLD